MLPLLNRLPYTRRLSPVAVFKNRIFLIKIAPNELGTSRFQVVISKKIDKRAVRRNRMRRLIHAFVTENILEFPAAYDYLFIVLNPFEQLPQDLGSNLASFFSRQKWQS